MVNQNTWRIVLIDDEEDIRDVMSITLRDEGYQVDTSADGFAGVEKCKEDPPQIVITDIRMPKMNGIAVLEAVDRKSVV